MVEQSKDIPEVFHLKPPQVPFSALLFLNQAAEITLLGGEATNNYAFAKQENQQIPLTFTKLYIPLRSTLVLLKAEII